MNKTVKVGDKLIGSGELAFIIAEIGSNHDKDLNQAKQLINAAYESGADAVKFQLFKAENFYPKNDPMFSVMKENEFPRKWLEELSKYAKNKGIVFLASAFDTEAVDLLVKLDIKALKIASSETTNLSLLRYSASTGLPLFISTGMCNLADIYEAIEIVCSTGNQNVVLLKCTSLYPTEPKDVNLRATDTLRAAFNLPVGLSDHTLGISIPTAAVARGACVIEKHLTLNKTSKGPDHFYAAEPDEFKQMVQAIREVEQSLGSATIKMLPEEKKVARRNSIFAKTDITKGTVITKNMIAVKRPALGIEPRFIECVIGQKAKRNIKQDEAVIWDMIK